MIHLVTLATRTVSQIERDTPVQHY